MTTIVHGLAYSAICFLLFTLGNFVFSIAEFKLKMRTIPRLLFILFSKLLSLTFIVVITLFFVWDGDVETKGIMALVSFSLLSVYLGGELFMTNKILFACNKFIEREPTQEFFEKFTKLLSKKILNNKFIFIMIYVFNLALIPFLIYKCGNCNLKHEISIIILYLVNFFCNHIMLKLINKY